MGYDSPKSTLSKRNMGEYKSWTYTIRTSTRARRIRITVSARDGIIIVIPQHSKPPNIPSLLEEHSQWIERALKKLTPVKELTFPHLIKFKAINETWVVRYPEDNTVTVVALDDSTKGILIARNFPNNTQEVALLINKWVRQKAINKLIPWVEHLSRLHGLDYRTVTIRRQKTRWGSCSSKKSININQNLMFLKPELVTYVILHELVHTEVQNHSRAFWTNLDTHIPKSKLLQAQLHAFGGSIPQWAWL